MAYGMPMTEEEYLQSQLALYGQPLGHTQMVAPVSMAGQPQQIITLAPPPPPMQANITGLGMAEAQAAALPNQAVRRAGFAGLTGKPTTYTMGSPEMIATQQRQQIQGAAALSGAAQLAQLGLAVVPTAQDLQNRRRLKEIQSERKGLLDKLKKNDFGLSPEERQLMEQSLMAPVQAMASESRKNEEAALASMGGTSAAQQVRAQREQRRAVAEAAQQAGARLEATNIQEAQRQAAEVKDELGALRSEEESRIAYKSEKQKGILQQLGQTISAGAALGGQVWGAQAIKNVDPKMFEADPELWTPERIAMYYDYKATGDDSLLKEMELYRLTSQIRQLAGE